MTFDKMVAVLDATQVVQRYMLHCHRDAGYNACLIQDAPWRWSEWAAYSKPRIDTIPTNLLANNSGNRCRTCKECVRRTHSGLV